MVTPLNAIMLIDWDTGSSGQLTLMPVIAATVSPLLVMVVSRFLPDREISLDASMQTGVLVGVGVSVNVGVGVGVSVDIGVGVSVGVGV